MQIIQLIIHQVGSVIVIFFAITQLVQDSFD